MSQKDILKPFAERIKFLQNQIRTAIRNHHVLLKKSNAFPEDTDIKNQMNIVQSLIISMGRTQNELLYQLDQEIKNGNIREEDVILVLARPIPPNIPQYKGDVFQLMDKKDNPDKADDDKPSVETPPVVKCYGKVHSLLKSSKKIQEATSKKLVKTEDSQTKEKKGEATKNVPRFQILKPKPDPAKSFIKIEHNGKVTQVGFKRTVSSDETRISPKRRRTVDGEDSKGSSRSNSPKTVNVPKRTSESKTFTRSKKKLAAAAAAAAALAASRGTSDMDLNVMEESLRNEPIDPNVPTDEQIMKNLETYEEMGQRKFLEHFSLISLSERDALTLKKCGRKRRTVAGQSSMYNDYFQPSALSMKNPKWRSEMLPLRRTSKDSVKKSLLPRALLEEEATEEALAEATEMAAMEAGEIEEAEGSEGSPGPPALPLPDTQSLVVVEAAPDIDDDDDKEKDKPCIVCHTSGEGLKSCGLCGERYHVGCAGDASEGGACPTCNQLSSIKSIVGEGEAGASAASTHELIRRYLT